MSSFIKRLKQIKKETFYISSFYVQELIELFNIKDKEDVNWIMWNNEKSNFYESDINVILRALLKESTIPNNEAKKIIENYRHKYLDNNSAISRSFCLIYISLFIEYIKIIDFRSIFRELFNNFHDDLMDNYVHIFYDISDEDYFIRTFNIYLEEETKYWNKFINKNYIEFLIGLTSKSFIEFINLLSSDWLIYLKDLNYEESENFIKKLESINNSNVNIKLRKLFLEIIEKFGEKKVQDYDYKQTIWNFLKSSLSFSLSKYLGDKFTNLSIDLLKIIGDIFYGLWENVSIVSSILRKKNIKELCELSVNNFFDVHVYENIEWWNRKDKEELLTEFKRYNSFNKKYKDRHDDLKKMNFEQEERIRKKREEFDKKIKEIIDSEKDNLKWINEYLLYQFENSEYQDFKDIPDVRRVVKAQIIRFFKLDFSDPVKYELHYTRKDDNSSSYTTHQFVAKWTFLRCLKFYKEFWLEINNDIREKAIKYVPFAYTNGLELIFSILWNGNLWKDTIDYLLSIYDWTRTKDDLRYNNLSTFILFYKKYKDSFMKFSKKKTQEVFFYIINDKNYKWHERRYACIDFVDILEEEHLLELFNKYKRDKNYFLEVLWFWILDDNRNEFEIALISSRELLKRLSNAKNSNEIKKIIEWYIKQLKIKVPLFRDYSEWVYSPTELESEISWDIDKDTSFISIFKYINDLSYEKEMKELLKFSFKILEESAKDYRLFWNYIQQAVYNFFESLNLPFDKLFENIKFIESQKLKIENKILAKDKFKILIKKSLVKENKWEILAKLATNKYYKYKDLFFNFLNEELEKVDNVSKPIIITEWKTDWKHLLSAWNNLNYYIEGFDKNYNFIFNELLFKYDDTEKWKDFWWDQNIKQSINTLSFYYENIKYYNNKLVIVIFDTDSKNLNSISSNFNLINSKNDLSKIRIEWDFWSHNTYKNLYWIFIPLPNHRRSKKDINGKIINKLYEEKWCCIELYYSNSTIKWNLLTKCMIDDLEDFEQWYKKYDKNFLCRPWSDNRIIFDNDQDKIDFFDISKNQIKSPLISKSYFADNIIKNKTWYVIWLDEWNNFIPIFDMIEKVIIDFNFMSN